MESSILHKTLRIGGMTCVNCQHKIEQTLRGIDGVVKVSVSYNKGTAHITYDTDRVSLRDITKVMQRLGYQVLPEQHSESPDLCRMISFLVIILCLFFLLQRFGVLNLLVPSQLADTTMGYGMLFLIGLITSVHCIAMCGGINLSQCVPQGERSSASAILPALLYNLGRVISYTVIGFLLGLVGLLIGGGSEVGVSTLLQGILKLLAGVLMVIMGINMLGLFPWLRRLTIRPPKFLAAKIGTHKAKSRRPLVVGLLNGLMPCGPLQSMQIVALASGNPFAGALSMFLFSLGTVPLMLGLGSIVSVLGKKFTRAVMTVGAVLVVVLGLAMLSQGGSLSGLLPPDTLFLLVVILSVLGVVASLPFRKTVYRIASLVLVVCAAGVALTFWGNRSAVSGESAAAADSSSASDGTDGVQVVTSTLTSGTYPNITVQAGIPVKWIIDAPAGSINGCNYKMLVQEYGIAYTLEEGENIIEFTPTEAGTVTYTCWMGMIHGNIFITDADGAVSDASTAADVPIPAGYQIPTAELAVAEMTTDESGEPMQQVTIRLTEEGYQPAIVVVQRDIPTLWTIENSLTTEGGTQLLAPNYSTALALAQGSNPLSLYPSESFEVSTGDNAFYAYVKVVEDLGQIDEEAIRTEVGAFETIIYPAAVFAAAGTSCCS